MRGFARAIVVAAFAALLAGCGTSGQADTAPEIGMTDMLVATSPDMGMAPGASPMQGNVGSAAVASPGSGVMAEDRSIARTGHVTLKAEDVPATSRRVAEIAKSAGGFVQDSSVQESAPGDQEAYLTVRVPSSRAESTLDAIGALGEVQSQGMSAMDLTGQVIDVDAQISAMQASVDRMRELMVQSGNLDDLIRVEQEMTNRQATLDALRGQRAALSSQADMAVISVSVLPQTTPEPPAEQPDGISESLAAGWQDAMLVARRVLAAAAYATPFAAALAVPMVAVAVVVLGVIFVARRKRRRFTS